MSSDLKVKENIIYITSQYSTPHEKVIRGLHNEIPGANIYLVRPSSLVVDLRLNNLVFLDGTNTNIPLRDSYADLLVVSDIPKKHSHETALREWCRVLKQEGKLASIVPTVNVRKYEDPMDIGNFIEKREHEASGKSEYLGENLIRGELEKSFQRVEEKQVIHVTIFQASEKIF